MTTQFLKETNALSAIEMQTVKPTEGEVGDTLAVKCYCCGWMEECTQGYIAGVREKYRGRWICGLCAEAVKEETVRSESKITTDEALRRHMMFCQQFRTSSPPSHPTEDLIQATKQLLLRTLNSPRKQGLTCRPLSGRSQSCFSSKPGTRPEAHTV